MEVFTALVDINNIREQKQFYDEKSEQESEVNSLILKKTTA